MKIVFLGSAHFAVPSLEALCDAGCRIECVITQPDRKGGRGMHLIPTMVKRTAERRGLLVFQPDNINQETHRDFLLRLEADIFIVIAYGQILSPEVLHIPPLGCLNVHASLLPKYRGAAPINRALIRGEQETGISLIQLVPRMDAGPVLIQQAFPILPNDDACSLEEKLAAASIPLLIEGLAGIRDGRAKAVAQDESAVSYAPKLTKEDGLIRWDATAEDVYNQVRGCCPWPCGHSFINGAMIKIRKCRLVRVPVAHGNTRPGEILKVGKEGIIVSCGRDAIAIEELQPEGKRMMTVLEFIAGHRLSPGLCFGQT
jgi:methionyl-tRNA formyltransferase